MWHALDEQRADLADLLEALIAAEWAQPSLCAGWTVRDVAAHLVLGPRMGVATVIVEMVRARGSFNQMIHETAIRHATRPVEDLVTELRAIVGARRLAPGQKLADALMDVLVHGQDIAIPLRRRRDMPAEAAQAAAQHLWRIGFPFHARKKLRGFRLRATDVNWTAGEGVEVRGPIAAIVALLAGRTATLPYLTGDGVPALATQLASPTAQHARTALERRNRAEE
ncbi:maleylpyruvate isomerase family mycothiol-dependent enzyme [Pseudonocardia sp. GCM10023141]|uniref:maleylpyruvate isomerase family mycothiol-dependent enzyme n=1 Tax=Pseudonocardia sp. GCM10023141 TaxID=3252653 RepID=UPI00361C8E45